MLKFNNNILLFFTYTQIIIISNVYAFKENIMHLDIISVAFTVMGGDTGIIPTPYHFFRFLINKIVFFIYLPVSIILRFDFIFLESPPPHENI